MGARALNLYWSARRLRPWRAVSWYIHARASILSGGLAYTALFSLFAALTIGYTALTSVLGGYPDAVEAALEQVDDVLPGLIAMEGRPGIIRPEELLSEGALASGLSVTSIVATVVLVYSVISFMSALRRSVRIMFGRRLDNESFVRVLARELVVLLAILVAVVVSTAAMVAESRFRPMVLSFLGIEGISSMVAISVGVTATVVINTAAMAVLVRALARIRVPRKDFVIGCLGAGVALAGLRYLGSSFISAAATRNAFLASFATLGTILLLVNFTARVVLLACAWMADPPVTTRYDPPAPPDEWEIRRGMGHGWPWSPVVRGYRRAKYPRGPV